MKIITIVSIYCLERDGVLMEIERLRRDLDATCAHLVCEEPHVTFNVPTSGWSATGQITTELPELAAQ